MELHTLAEVGEEERRSIHKHAVEMVRDLMDGIVPREAGYARPTGNKTTEDILLDTTIDDSDMCIAVGASNMEGGFSRHLLDEIDLLGIYESLVLIRIILLSNRDSGQRGPLFPQVRDNGPRIHTRDCGDALARTPVTETLNRGPMRVLFCYVGDNNSDGLEMRGLEVSQQAIRVARVRGDAIVPNKRLGEDQDLSAVRRVRKGFRVADEGSGEDSFAGGVGAGTEGFAMEDGAVLGGG